MNIITWDRTIAAGLTKRARVEAIICEVAEWHRVSGSVILGTSSGAPAVAARAEAMWRLREELRFLFPHIGLIFCKHHSTIMYAIDKVQKCLAEGREWPVLTTPSDRPFSVGELGLNLSPDGRVFGKQVEAPAGVANGHPAAQLANRINTVWSQRGVDANARVVRVGQRVVVRSDIQVAVME